MKSYWEELVVVLLFPSFLPSLLFFLWFVLFCFEILSI